MSDPGYVHGYSLREAARLADQADTLAELLHSGTHYPAGARVLECGCGTGAQTVHLAASSPEAEIVSVDIDPASLERARARVEAAGYGNVSFRVADVFDLPCPEESFDHGFVRFVLGEGGSITVIEGDHGSWYCHPSTPEAERTVECLVEIQARHDGDALIGRRLYPLLADAGFHTAHVSPRLVYVDDSRPDLIGGFSRNTFIAMVEGSWDKGIADMHRATEPGGTFSYTFFKGTALKRA